MITEPDIADLEASLRSLENECRQLRASLIDDYATHALGGLIAYGYSPREQVVEEAFRIANLCLAHRSDHV